MRRALAFLALVLACDKSNPPEPRPAVASAQPAVSSAQVDVGSLGVSKPAPERVVALGDLHGDLDAARRALRLAGAIDDKDKWSGGKLVVVQTGDLVDRGDDDRTILDLVERLKNEAKAAGGEFVALNGNHEIMNAQLDFRYVTPGGFSAFNDVAAKSDEAAEAASKVAPAQRGRAAAFLPGGSYAKQLANRPLMARVGDSLFVHGGILPKHVQAGLDRINSETREWLNGERRKLPKEIEASDGPLWTRMFSEAPAPQDCAVLEETLKLLKAKRLVMGHTPQKPDIAPCCAEKGWRIDTGMSKYYQGNVEVLELRGDTVKVLKEGMR